MSQNTNQEDPLFTIQNWPYFNFFGPERNLTGRKKFKELYVSPKEKKKKKLKKKKKKLEKRR